MKTRFLFAVFACSISVALQAQIWDDIFDQEKSSPSYCVFVSPDMAKRAALNEVLSHLNNSVQGYFRELNRENIRVIENERKFMDFLETSGLVNTRQKLRAREWEEVEYIIYFNFQKKQRRH